MYKSVSTYIKLQNCSLYVEIEKSRSERISVKELLKNISPGQFIVLDCLAMQGTAKEPVHTSLLYDSLGCTSSEKRRKIAEVVNYLYKNGFIDGRYGILNNANSIKLNITEKGLEALGELESNPQRKKDLLLAAQLI